MADAGGHHLLSWEEIAAACDGPDEELAGHVASDMVRYLTVASASHGAITPELWSKLPGAQRELLCTLAGAVIRRVAEASAEALWERLGRPTGNPLGSATMGGPTKQRVVLASDGEPHVLAALQHLW